jgi:MFS superfamily sulfate permease-like transporter
LEGLKTSYWPLSWAVLSKSFFGLLKAGVIGYYFPSSVIKGMLTGIGIIIVIKQIPYFFGYEKALAENASFNEIFNFISPGATLNRLYWIGNFDHLECMAVKVL